jgi:hypothetical protein
MGRILLEYVLPIALPTLIYFAWLAAERRRQARLGKGEPPRWQDAPWLWLGGLGLVLAAVITIGFALLRGEGTEGRYVPPRLEGGRIVPGHVEPPAR